MKTVQQATEEKPEEAPKAMRLVSLAETQCEPCEPKASWIFAVNEVRGVRSKAKAFVVDSGAELHVCPQSFHRDDGLQSKVPGRD